ncbi:hypothetical protein [Paramicrobacterium humi]|uniref:hypothetical protein n=1 Tax=Paramicrobacterium humi TaxID=640635 RepID=UPI0015A44A0D|nr:hypothetical protein [Microbacterium humi]
MNGKRGSSADDDQLDARARQAVELAQAESEATRGLPLPEDAKGVRRNRPGSESRK